MSWASKTSAVLSSTEVAAVWLFEVTSKVILSSEPVGISGISSSANESTLDKAYDSVGSSASVSW